MCGIAGYFGARALGSDAVAAVMAAIARRGPDARQAVGWIRGQRIAESADATEILWHTRLSIRDPRPDANQPMSSDNGKVWLCYNGEVYGWEAERDTLQARGIPFRTQSDTEFILRGYEAWGIEALLPKLRGMFSFAIFDLVERKLHLVRDRMGLKPLLYHHDSANGAFGFGSLVRSVLPMLPAEQRSLDPEAIDAYLAHRTIPAPYTVFRNIRRLENAHRLEFDLQRGALRKIRYWIPTPRQQDPIEVLDQAVRLRTVADRPVGIFLSGGIDSSVVASRLAAQGYTNLRTYTAGFSDASMDESPVAARTATYLRMPNTRVAMTDAVGENFMRIVADFDEPFADPSSFPTWELSRAVAREVKVVLCGDGGDEMFAGYKRYRQHLRSAWRRNLPVLKALRPRGEFPSSKQSRLRYEAAITWDEAYALRFSGFSAVEREALQPDLGIRPAHHWRSEDSMPREPIERLLEVDRLNYLPEYILRKADLATMAHGLEARAPLLDHHFVESLSTLPRNTRFTNPAKVWLVQRCEPCQALGLIELKKRGFNPSVSAMLRRGLAERLEGLGSRLSGASSGQLSAEVLDDVVGTWRSEGAYSEQLLQLLILDESLRQLRTPSSFN